MTAVGPRVPWRGCARWPRHRRYRRGGEPGMSQLRLDPLTGRWVVSPLGPVFTQAPASGIHEVLVLSPDHTQTWADMSEAHAGLVMTAISDRLEQHSLVPGLRYSQVAVNCGREAGASIEHPHGQLLSAPFVPGEAAEELAGFARFQGNCLLCAVTDAEEDAGHRVVYADEQIVVICPFWSGTPY